MQCYTLLNIKRMKQAAHNTFTQGMVTDLTPLTTPNNVLTDCLNGTIITYSGNEFTLQNDMGNCQVGTAYLKPGYLPVGMTEYGGIVYIASHNPETGMDEIGSFPSPQRDFSTTDYNNIGPVEFKTETYTVNTGSPVKENLSVVRKLFEPEIFTLKPGDMYLVEYTINDPASGDPDAPDTINTEDKLENYVTKDITDRKLFRLKFYKITSSNNLVELDETKINVVPHAPDIDLDNEYRYFTESSSSVIAASLELESLDLFQASVVDASVKTNSNKKVGIEAIGKSASLADFQGVRVDVTQPSTLTTYLDKGSNVTNKVSAVLDGLVAHDNFECTVTPYSKYCLYPSLKQQFKFTLGKYLTTGSGVNNLFRYYVDPTYIKIDFDYTFQGNSANGPYLYIEFYDPWSDYSIIKPVDNPTFYGINTVIIGTVNEPLIDQFDSTTVGGTSPNKLITNSDTTYQTTLLNSTGKIRTDQFLRLNTFYIVRISGVDPDTSSGTLVYKHYDFYKGIYTTPMFNDIYIAQSGLTITDPAYVSDFNQLDFDISQISYQPTISQTGTNAPSPLTINTPSELMTNGQFYMIDPVKNTSFTNYLNSKTFTSEANYTVGLQLKGTEEVFGIFKDSLVSITLPTLVDSDHPNDGSAPIVTNQNYDNNTNVSPNSIGSWTITAVGDALYNINTKLITTRNIYAPVAYDNSKQGTSYKEIPLINSFLYRPNGDSAFINEHAAMQFTRLPEPSFIPTPHQGYVDYYDSSGSTQSQIVLGTPQSNNIYAIFNNQAKKYSGIWGGIANDSSPSRWYGIGAPGTYGAYLNGDNSWRQNILFLWNDTTGKIVACRTHDIDAAIDFFSTSMVASNVTSNLWLHYADGHSIEANGNIITTSKFGKAPVVTNFTPTAPGVKTYLSNFRFIAMSGTIQEFNPTIINDYIASRVSDSVILDGKNSIRDGFIPYIDTASTSSFDLSFNDITINQAPDANTLQNIQNAFTIGGQDPIYTTAGNYKTHGTLFSTKPEVYGQFLTKFSVGHVSDGVEVNNTVYIKVLSGSEPFYTGEYARGGKPKAGPGPDIYIDFTILKG